VSTLPPRLPAPAHETTWLERLRSTLVMRQPCEPLGTVYLLVDCSGSMGDGNKLLQAKLGVARFSVEAWKKHYAVGLVRFSSRASCLMDARTASPRLERYLAALKAEGGTAMAGAIDLAARRLVRRKGDKIICLITDGKPDDRQATLGSARMARAQGIHIVAVGTDGADEAFLAALAGHPELATTVPRTQLAEGVSSMARLLP
jgi:Mg-chelatase subunit ChlD